MTPQQPLLRPFGRTHVAAPTGEEAAAFDRRAIEGLGVPQSVLMENAGRSAAQVLQRLFPTGPVVGLVGAGNNGGDALVLLRTLAAWGRDVTAVLVADRAAPEALTHGWPVRCVDDRSLTSGAHWAALLSPAAVLVDGILGTGARGEPRPRQAGAIRRSNHSGRAVLALDIPSGVDAGTGEVAGEAVQAHVTVSFGAPKLGALLHPGRARAGRVVAVEIGFPPMEAADAGAWAVTPAWAQEHLPGRGLDTHKNAVGRLVVVAGRPGMAGAAVLAARAAFRAGAGLVQVASHPSNRTVLQSAVPEAIFVDPEDGSALDDALAQASAVAVGPGLGTDGGAEALFERVLAGSEHPLVVDADALNLLAAGRPRPAAEALRGRRVLVTPHPGEMGRLLPDAEGGRVAMARAAAESLGCAVIFKGAPSLVAAAGHPVLVDLQGSSDLAVAGMGDVLTGVCGSLAAQGCTPRDAGAVGLYLTGRAAAVAGRGKALTPGEVVRWLPQALAERGCGTSELELPFVLLDLDPAR
ncbi:MAG TPA: NAD(P)H-hydrate dehydratase [Longimicrobiales bacterium]|nr:NAD(P)H-hydrate dehydratase [Longimicrobiales bacterium]